jgi:hypothetical protein
MSNDGIEGKYVTCRQLGRSDRTNGDFSSPLFTTAGPSDFVAPGAIRGPILGLKEVEGSERDETAKVVCVIRSRC